MGIGGVACGYTEDDICDALKIADGRISVAAYKLNLCRYTLYRKINASPRLQEVLKELREDYKRRACDLAEAAVMAIMQRHDSDAANALKASIFTLNNLGRDYGYNHPEVAKAQEDRGLADMILACQGVKVVDTKPKEAE